MRPSEIQSWSPRPFPRWLGPLWLFIVFLEKGWDSESLLIYGCIPWLCGWVFWTTLVRTNFVQQASSHIVDRLWRFAAGAIWVTAIGVGGGIYYVNHHLPRGPMYATGDVVCLNDDRGPCADEYRENFQHLDIPVWAKFLKGKRAELLLMAMVFAGIMASTRPNGGYKNDADD